MQVISKAFATEYDNIKEVTAEMIWPCFIVPTLCAPCARRFNLPSAKVASNQTIELSGGVVRIPAGRLNLVGVFDEP